MKSKSISYTGWVVFFFGVYLVLIIKYVTLQFFDNNLFFGLYSLVVSFYILSRFLISHFYRGSAEFNTLSDHDLPTITFSVPAKNEQDNIYETITKIAESDYPKHKFNIIAVNDGSTDNTLKQMQKAQAQAQSIGVEVKIVNWTVNQGKRSGMAEGVMQSHSEIIIFIDSDSFVQKDTARQLVKYFIDPKVAAVAGHAFVANANTNLLTKMQQVRYFVAFKGYKSAEAIFGSVTCCSGCCSAYRRSLVLEVIDKWKAQTFLGVNCTYGDDRALTNYLLQKGYKALYAPDAYSYTIVPHTWKQFMKQQLRWKKSWVRESLKAATFMWKRNPIMSLSFYISIILPLLAPLVVARSLIWFPLYTKNIPWFYLFGLVLMAFIYGIYYYIYTHDKNWIYGVVFSAFYTLILIWQLPYAVLNIRDSRWGTR